MLPAGPQLARYNREMGADFKKWRDQQTALGVDKACFGCLRVDHGWRRDFGNCSADACPICRTKFTDSRNGHCAMDCYQFPQTPSAMGALLADLEGKGQKPKRD